MGGKARVGGGRGSVWPDGLSHALAFLWRVCPLPFLAVTLGRIGLPSAPQGSSAAIWVLSAGYKHEAGLVFASGVNVPGLNSLTACLTRCPTPVQGLECSRHST